MKRDLEYLKRDLVHMERDVLKKVNAHMPCDCVCDTVFFDVGGTPKTKKTYIHNKRDLCTPKVNAHIPCDCVCDTVFFDVEGTPQTKETYIHNKRDLCTIKEMYTRDLVLTETYERDPTKET